MCQLELNLVGHSSRVGSVAEDGRVFLFGTCIA